MLRRETGQMEMDEETLFFFTVEFGPSRPNSWSTLAVLGLTRSSLVRAILSNSVSLCGSLHQLSGARTADRPLMGQPGPPWNGPCRSPLSWSPRFLHNSTSQTGSSECQFSEILSDALLKKNTPNNNQPPQNYKQANQQNKEGGGRMSNKLVKTPLSV